LVGSAPYFLNLPEGVSIGRDGPSTGLIFTADAAERFGIDSSARGVHEL